MTRSEGDGVEHHLKQLVISEDPGNPLRIMLVRPPFPWKRLIGAVLTVLGLWAGGWLFIRLGDVVIMVALAALLAFILDPLVIRLHRKMPRWVGIIVVYVGLVAILVTALLRLVPTVVAEVQTAQRDKLQDLRASFQRYSDQFTAYLDSQPQLKKELEKLQTTAQGWVSNAGSTLLHTMLLALGWIGRGALMLVMSIYLLLDKERLRDGLINLIPLPARAETLSVIGDVLDVIRAYLRGQIVVIGFVAGAVTLVCFCAGLSGYAVTVGLIAGVLEVIPYFGSVVGAVPAVLYTFAVHGMWGGLAMIAFFILINQIEGHVVIPMVMGRNLEMRPIAVLLSLLVGAELGGIVGLIVAVPLCRILQVFIEHAIVIYKRFRDLSAAAPRREARLYVEVEDDEVGTGLEEEAIAPQDRVVPPQDRVVPPQDRVVPPQDRVVPPQVPPQDSVVVSQDDVGTGLEDEVGPPPDAVAPPQDATTAEKPHPTLAEEVTVPTSSDRAAPSSE